MIFNANLEKKTLFLQHILYGKTSLDLDFTQK